MIVWHRCGRPLCERMDLPGTGPIIYWFDPKADPTQPGKRLRCCPGCGWVLRSRDMRFKPPETAGQAAQAPGQAGKGEGPSA